MTSNPSVLVGKLAQKNQTYTTSSHVCQVAGITPLVCCATRSMVVDLQGWSLFIRSSQVMVLIRSSGTRGQSKSEMIWKTLEESIY